MITRTRIRAAILVLAIVLALTGCSSNADTASENIRQASENFEVERRIIFVNAITDKYLLMIEGKCSYEVASDQVQVTCKVGDNAFKKHVLGRSDNVTFFVEQVEAANVDTYHYRVVFRPETIIPDVDTQTSGQDG